MNETGEIGYDVENEGDIVQNSSEEEVSSENIASGEEGAIVMEGMPEAEQDSSLAYIESLLDERIVRAIKEMGFDQLTPIQEMAIPRLLNGEDIIGQAQTGTGKTAAFGIPALQKIDPTLQKLQTIILCPTRELAMQAAEEIRKIAKYMQGIRVLPVYGGQDIGKQISGLRGTQIIVGTPGRVMDHMRRHTIKLDNVNMVVLDEADEMLDMGFREDMELILGQVENEHQTAMFSATMPQPILDIANRFQKDAQMVKVAAKELTIPLVSQRYYRIRQKDKDAACIRLLEYFQPRLCLIFCNTKLKVDELAEVIRKAGFRAEGLHGDLSQHQRDVAMNRFRNGSTNILIATDVAARGIDVDNVEAVINYDLPQDIEYYVHRIGRTGRAGKKGRSFTFVSAKEFHRIRQIERFCNTTIEEKKLPGAAKALRAKADKYMEKAWELHEHDDIELMKSYLLAMMNREDCELLDLAAAMLKYQVGDMGPEIEEDTVESRRSGRGDRGRGGRKRGGREEERGGRGDRRRAGREEEQADHGSDGKDSREEEREGRSDRRSKERGEGRDGRRKGDREEERESRSDRRSRERGEGRDGRRKGDREEERESRSDRRSRERGEGWDGRRKGDREERRRGKREEERGSRGRDREEDTNSRKRGSHEEEHVMNRAERRAREFGHLSKVRDVKMDGSEKGIGFSFPKKKRRK